ncbi:MAG TPA: hypothetical protein H9731_05920 [Candidatus Borkfalkia excrementipullorum]|nr:hypothetical protein [Candidatus Borkfalkia excrementipullorum]
MSFKRKIRVSKFLISLGFSVGYAAYFAYALYFYLTYRTGLGIALLCLIAIALALSVVVTAVSYRVNLKGAKKPRVHRFIKIAKYSVQLLCSGFALGLVFSAVYAANVFSVIMACISIPFLLLSLFANVLAEYFQRKFADGYGRRVFVPVTPQDAEGEPLDLDEAIARAGEDRPAERGGKEPSSRAKTGI